MKQIHIASAEGPDRIRSTPKEWATAALAVQMQWMQERGTTLAGYLRFYSDCSPNNQVDPDQVQKIWQADKNELDRWVREVEELRSA